MPIKAVAKKFLCGENPAKTHNSKSQLKNTLENMDTFQMPAHLLEARSRPEVSASAYSEEDVFHLTEEEEAVWREMDDKKAARRRIAERKLFHPQVAEAHVDKKLRTQEEVVADMVKDFNARKAEREGPSAEVHVDKKAR